MNMKTRTTLLLALSLPLLGACNQAANRSQTATTADTTASDATHTPQTMIGKAVDKGMRKARAELEHGNLSLNGSVHISKDGVWSGSDDNSLPKAEISPQGDLLIDDKSVAIDAPQRALLLNYRHQVIGIAEAGMALGTKGADLAGKAMAEGVSNIFKGGDNKEFERRMEAEGKKIEAQAKLLCRRLPQMLDTQEQLAASLPAFKPYARMTHDDIDDCMDDHDGNDAARRAQVQEQVRASIRQNIRKSVRTAVQTATAPVTGSTDGTDDTDAGKKN